FHARCTPLEAEGVSAVVVDTVALDQAALVNSVTVDAVQSAATDVVAQHPHIGATAETDIACVRVRKDAVLKRPVGVAIIRVCATPNTTAGMPHRELLDRDTIGVGHDPACTRSDFDCMP